MLRLNLKDKNFFPDLYSARSGTCELLEWDRSCSQDGIIVYSDMFLNSRSVRSKERRIAWLLEPAEVYPQIYGWVKHNYSLFEQVWTHDQELLDFLPNAKWVPMAGTWIGKEERRIYSKTKLCSFIASDKNFTTGHKLRQQVRSILPSNIDKYGKGFHYVPNKINCLKDYCFSIVIENCNRDAYFTEKIIDCFNTGTIPVYWGTSRITEHFNGEGIIQFSRIQELKYILELLTVDLYHRKQAAIIENFERAKLFETGEEWIANYLFNV